MIGPPARPGRYVVLAGLAACARRPGSGQPRACKQAVPVWPTSMPAESAIVYAQDFKLDSEWTGRPHERRATDPRAARDDALPSLRIPTRTGLTTADPIPDIPDQQCPGSWCRLLRKVQPNGHGRRACIRVYQFRPARVHTAHPPGPRRPLPVPARSRSAALLPPLLR